MKNAMGTATITETKTLSDSLEKNESYYLELREKLNASGQLLGKHKATVEATKSEAVAANEEWKAALRGSGGSMSKSIRELKRRELAARETAEEFAALVLELEPQFNDLQIVACSARRNYIAAFMKVKRNCANVRLESVAETVFSTEQGRELLGLLLHQADQVKADCAADVGVQEIVRAGPQSGSSVDDIEFDITTRRIQAFVYDFIKRHGRNVDHSEESNINSELIPLGPFELDHTKASPLAAAIAASRLKASSPVASLHQA